MADNKTEASSFKRAEATKRRLRRRRRDKILYTLFIIALLAAVVISILGRDGGKHRDGEVTLRVDTGASASAIARQLLDENVITSEKDFMNAAEQSGAADSLKAGVYRFERGEPLSDIVARLQNGEQTPEGVITIPEGYSLNEIAAELAARTDNTIQQYIKAAVPAGRTLPVSGATGALTLEGLLFPSTYDLEPDLTSADMVDLQLEAFKTHTGALPWANTDKIGVSQYQALTVASMVEREAKLPEERPLIAAVIYNRMAAGMKLEVDATVQYALGYWKQDLTQADLETDSPYNTRLYAGLPPGPICNPGADSIKAALEPAAVDYLFYVATGDEAGHHFFTASYDEFLKAEGEG